jgi:hypothetical protein
MLFRGIGVSWLTVLGAAVAAWAFVRWRRERDKPINRLRRQAGQAVHAASELRERLPAPEDAARPALGLTAALVSILVVLWQQSQSRSTSATRLDRASSMVADDSDWQKRLIKLKERWTPGRVELEKFSISRH